MSQYAYVSLSLIGLCALAGAGVGVGSGVAMMYSQMAQAEQEHKTSGAVAHSPVERKNVAASRGFAAAGARSQIDRDGCNRACRDTNDLAKQAGQDLQDAKPVPDTFADGM
ncbi:MAG: hypothetical protein FRX49_11061 [Trebouxia sp. A1-2]|nr:MAG: hypothetical protein FRX49_11061 [Trebouxia sp. A1-2]